MNIFGGHNRRKKWKTKAKKKGEKTRFLCVVFFWEALIFICLFSRRDDTRKRLMKSQNKGVKNSLKKKQATQTENWRHYLGFPWLPGLLVKEEENTQILHTFQAKIVPLREFALRKILLQKLFFISVYLERRVSWWNSASVGRWRGRSTRLSLTTSRAPTASWSSSRTSTSSPETPRWTSPDCQNAPAFADPRRKPRTRWRRWRPGRSRCSTTQGSGSGTCPGRSWCRGRRWRRWSQSLWWRSSPGSRRDVRLKVKKKIFMSKGPFSTYSNKNRSFIDNSSKLHQIFRCHDRKFRCHALIFRWNVPFAIFFKN